MIRKIMSINVFSSWSSFMQEEVHSVQDDLLPNKVNYWMGEECQQFKKACIVTCDKHMQLY